MSPEHRELYAAHTRGMRKMTAMVQKRTSPVEKVVAAIHRCLTAKRPRARYVVGSDARALLAMAALTPTRVLDAGTARMSWLEMSTADALVGRAGLEPAAKRL